jgi:hypothetical protein
LGIFLDAGGEEVLSCLIVAGGEEKRELCRLLAVDGVVASCLIFGGGVDSSRPDRVVLGLSTALLWMEDMALRYSSLV